MKKLEIEIPENIFDIISGSQSGITIDEDIVFKGLKLAFFTEIIKTYKDFPEVLEWASTEAGKAVDEDMFKRILKNIADQI